MKIIFDLTKTQPIGKLKFHGGGKYGEVVFTALVKKNKDIIAYYNPSLWFNPDILNFCINHNIKMVDATKTTLKQAVQKYDGIVYSPLVEKDLSKIDSIQYICTIHGLRILEMPFDKYLKYYKKNIFTKIYEYYSFWKSKKDFNSELIRYRKLYKKNNIHTITVSEHSKSSILSFIPSTNNEDIQVYYSPSTTKNTEKKNTNYLSEKYYLLVSTNRWVKNSIRAIKAFDEIFDERPEFKGKVILTGAPDKDLFYKNIRNKSRFEIIEYVDDNKLQDLYQNAFAFVYPSLNEGFGYPPLEAMFYGTPVIASAISSIPEICGNAVLYFNPLLISEIKMRILQLEDSNIRKEYCKKAKERSQIIESKQDFDLEQLTEYILSFLKN